MDVITYSEAVTRIGEALAGIELATTFIIGVTVFQHQFTLITLSCVFETRRADSMSAPPGLSLYHTGIETEPHVRIVSTHELQQQRHLPTSIRARTAFGTLYILYS